MGIQKAITAALAPIVSVAAAYWALPDGLDQDTLVAALGAIVAVVASLAVYIVPNKE